nr:hypothetical protein [Tanacetum cinerariifolium]
MTRRYFIQYTGCAIPEFRDTLIQHFESVKKSIDERVQLKREYDSWVNERQMQTTEEKDTSSRSGNDADDDDADIRPIYDEELMAEVQTTAEINVFAKLLKENESLKKNYKELFDSIKITRDKTTIHTTSLIATNDKFKAQHQEKGFAITALKIKLRKSTGNSVNTKFAKSSILGKPMSQPFRNQSAVRQPTAFKSERPRFSKPQCDSQVDVHNDLSKPITTYYFPKEREVASAKPHHMIASRNSRISRNSEPSLLHSARSKSTANGSKPMPRRNTQTSRNWPATKNSFVTTKTVPIAKHPRNSRNDSCVIKFLKEVNSHARVPSKKTTNRNKPVEQIVGLRWVPTGKILSSSTTNVDTKPLNGSNADITNDCECKQTLNLSTGTSFNPKEEGLRVCLELGPHDHNNEQSSLKLVPDVIPQADKTATSRQMLELLFHHHITMLRKTT